jgi:hypothetical protein
MPAGSKMNASSLRFASVTEEELKLAKKTVFVSDLSGREIPANDAAKVTITYADARRGQIVLDVLASEVEDLAGKGVRQARRGRKPKGAA